MPSLTPLSVTPVGAAAIPPPSSPALNDALVWNGSEWVSQKIANAQVDAAAAIAYTKLALASSIVNADIAAGAAIAKSKLASLGIVNADVDAAAAISRSKLNFGSGLVDADIAAGAAIAISKVAGAYSGPTTYRKTTAKTVNTTVSATDLLNGEITIAALSASSLVRATLWGDVLNNTGGNTNTDRLQVVFGGTTILDTGAGAAASFGAGASRFPWRAVIEIFNLGATNAQSVSFLFEMQGAAVTSARTAFTTGEGQVDGNGASTITMQGFATATIDTSSSRALVFNVINPSASASYETKLFGALVEIV